MDPSRPKRGETDEDLLQMQKDFLANKSAPSAKVIRVGDKRKQDVTPPSSATPRDVVTLGVDLNTGSRAD